MMMTTTTKVMMPKIPIKGRLICLQVATKAVVVMIPLLVIQAHPILHQRALQVHRVNINLVHMALATIPLSHTNKINTPLELISRVKATYLKIIRTSSRILPETRRRDQEDQEKEKRAAKKAAERHQAGRDGGETAEALKTMVHKTFVKFLSMRAVE